MINVVVTVLSGVIVCAGVVISAISLITPGHQLIGTGIAVIAVGAIGVVGLWRRKPPVGPD